MFDSKTKLKGQREPLFPNGVPGTTTGVPADLVKGYQPPPDQTDADASAQTAPAPAAAPKPVEKPKPKPKVAVGRPRARAAKIEKPPSSRRRGSTSVHKGAPPQQPSAAPGRIRRRRLRSRADNSPGRPRHRRHRAAPAQQAAQPSQSVWPAPPSTAPTQLYGCAISHINLAIRALIRFDVAETFGEQHVHPIVRGLLLQHPPLRLLCK